MPQGVDMGIAPTADHKGQQQRAKYIPALWGVRAAVLQRTVLNRVRFLCAALFIIASFRQG